MTYLGHIINEKGIHPDPKKVAAVQEFPTPRNVRNVRQFIGLAECYRRFIKDFANIAKPLIKLLQNEVQFDWTEDAQESFVTLKEMLCNPPLLQYPDMSQPFIMTTDASGYAIHGILSQRKLEQDKPTLYFSRVLRGAELNYDVYEKEALAMLCSVKTFRSYVFGRKVTIVTDHQPLVWFKSADLNTRVQKWRFKLAEYDYDVVYKLGLLNKHTDALSRNRVIQASNFITRNQRRMSKQKEYEAKSIQVEAEIQSKPISRVKNRWSYNGKLFIAIGFLNKNI